MSIRRNPLQDLAISIAIAEVLNPTFGVTQQVLSVHRLVMRDGTPSILLVDTDSEPGAYFIYFKVADEPYHFVVVIREEQQALTVSAVYIEATVRVTLYIDSTTLHPDTITERLGINPTRKQILGEAIRPQSPHNEQPRRKRTGYRNGLAGGALVHSARFQDFAPRGGEFNPYEIKKHVWRFEPQKDIPGNLENKLQFLLEQLEPVQSAIASLPDSCEICISIVYKGYSAWMGGWHIDEETLQRIVALGAEVDLDLYAYGKQDLPS